MNNRTVEIMYNDVIEKSKSFLFQELGKIFIWLILSIISMVLVFNFSPIFIIPLSFFAYKTIYIMVDSFSVIRMNIVAIILMRKLRKQGVM